MTKEEEIPDWVGAKEFYDKYEPKEILGRYVYETVVVTWPIAEVHPTELSRKLSIGLWTKECTVLPLKD